MPTLRRFITCVLLDALLFKNMSPASDYGDLKAVQNVQITPQTDTKATGALIFLHGSSDSGDCFRRTVNSLLNGKANFPHIKILYPTAWMIPYSPLNGLKTNTWYDISSYSMDAIENKKELEVMSRDLQQIINKLNSEGIPTNRIVIGGFSRGGAMSANLAFCDVPDLAGVAVMSSWIPTTSNFYECVQENARRKRLPRLLQQHGSVDSLVSPSLGEKTFSILKSIGVEGEFIMYPNLGHEISRSELEDFFSFVAKVVPQ